MAQGATTADLAARAERAASAAGGTVGFSATCGDPPRTVSVGEDVQLRGASTLKIGIALADAIGRGAPGSQMESDGVLRSAIIDSDNSAANALFERAGSGSTSAGVQATNQLFASLGMSQTRFDGPYIDTAARSQKVTTAGDLRLLAEALLGVAEDGSGPLARLGATRQQGQALIALMSRVTYPSVFAGGGATQVAHKPGWLDDAQNDLAIITLPSGEKCAAGFVSEGLSLSQAQEVGSDLMTNVVAPLASTAGSGTSTTPATVPTAPATTATVATPSETATTTAVPEQASPPSGAPEGARWYADWRVWALAALGALLVALSLRQRQVSRRRRSRRRPRR